MELCGRVRADIWWDRLTDRHLQPLTLVSVSSRARAEGTSVLMGEPVRSLSYSSQKNQDMARLAVGAVAVVAVVFFSLASVAAVAVVVSVSLASFAFSVAMAVAVALLLASCCYMIWVGSTC